MADKKAKNCWNFWKCPKGIREKCIIYKVDGGDNCWYYQNVEKIKCPTGVKAGIKQCFDCPFFKDMNPDFDKK